jgi:SAM-dependent methyltransferase
MPPEVQSSSLAPSLPGFELEADTGLYVQFGRSEPFGYSDGDSEEQRLLDILQHASDLRTGSLELRAHINGWVSDYHLNPQRASLLIPFADLLRGKQVLDIGAGFGALTRFLGESAASVLAIEPSHRRARGCLARCRDLPNVRAVCTDLNRMPEGLTADVVVAVGVLEYSRMFGRPVPEAPLCFLRELLTHVDEGGTLILAIENQLGLKYLAGAPEDHTSTPFTGVEGRYTASGPVTFGRAKLEDLFSEAGFQWTRFFYPLPDYKMPGCIMSEKAFASRAKVARTLPRLMSAPDRGIRWTRLVSEELAWPVMVENGLGPHVANSFLVFAGMDAPPRMLETSSAYVVNGTRRRCYTKLTTVDLGRNLVRRERLYPEDSPPETARIVQRFPHEEPLLDYPLLGEGLLEIMNTPGWTEDRIAAWMRPLVQFLSSRSDARGLLPPDYVDYTPFNIACDGHDLLTFDLEWTADEPVPMSFVLCRGVFWAIARPLSPAMSGPLRSRRVLDILARCLELCGFTQPEDIVSDFVEREAALQEVVCGSANARTVLPTIEVGPARPHDVMSLVADLSRTRDLLAAQQDTLTRGDQELSQRDLDLVRRDQELADLRRHSATLEARIAEMALRELQQQEQVSALRAEIETTSRDSARQQGQIAAVQAEIDMTSRDSARHRHESEQYLAQLVQIRDSITWRLGIRCGSVALRLPVVGRMIRRIQVKPS